MKFTPGEYHRTQLRSLHRFGLWFGAIRQQAITRSNVDIWGHYEFDKNNSSTDIIVVCKAITLEESSLASKPFWYQMMWEMHFTELIHKDRAPLFTHGFASLSSRHMGPLLLAWFDFNPSMDKCMPSKVWDEITYPFPNFNSYAVEVGKWISNFILNSIMDVLLIQAKKGPLLVMRHHPQCQDLDTCRFLAANCFQVPMQMPGVGSDWAGSLGMISQQF